MKGIDTRSEDQARADDELLEQSERLDARKPTRRVSIKRRRAIVVVLIVLIIVAGSLALADMSRAQSRQRDLNNQLSLLNEQRTTLQQQLDSKNAEVTDQVSGVDNERLSKDEAKVIPWAKLLTTWQNGSEYQDARDKAQAQIGPAASKDLFTGFMPELTPIAKVDGSGNTNIVDAQGLTMTYLSMKTYLRAVHGSDYSYVGIVDVGSEGKAHNRTTSQVIMTWTSHEDGSVSDFSAQGSTAW